MATASYLKEDLRQLRNQSNKQLGAEFETRWFERANSADIPTIKNFAKML